MTIREETEAIERAILSPYAALSVTSLGRDKPDEPCPIRTCYQQDRDRILHCKAFRRLKHKTQVFLAPTGDHYRTRLTHTLEVAQIARTIARALRLNEDLTEAIALGHDLGHTPFGHAGERVLNEVCPEGFSHYDQGIRVVERLEKDGKGLNLTREVRDGIFQHRLDGTPMTMEGKVVQLSDKIAYINHDIDDAMRAGLLTEEMLPVECTAVLGHSVRERLDTMVRGIIDPSLGKPAVTMKPRIQEAVGGLRQFMFDRIYTNSKPKEEEGKAQQLVASLYQFYMEHTELLPREYVEAVWMYQEPWCRAVCDYISGMTDDYAIAKYKELFLPKGWEY
ncbi:MAG: deoxyguanosinetriphosphate triphosphohydrolase [Lachnospiraceae bacterium]|nr:deoxyguanosinetriphosphate triphosphohydrolase [Lachnospiraceae bacterium]